MGDYRVYLCVPGFGRGASVHLGKRTKDERAPSSSDSSQGRVALAGRSRICFFLGTSQPNRKEKSEKKIEFLFILFFFFARNVSFGFLNVETFRFRWLDFFDSMLVASFSFPFLFTLLSFFIAFCCCCCCSFCRPIVGPVVSGSFPFPRRAPRLAVVPHPQKRRGKTR